MECTNAGVETGSVLFKGNLHILLYIQTNS